MTAWGGSLTRRARAHFAARLPLACSRCGLDVTGREPWHVDHLKARAAAGGNELANLWPAHARCNEAAGQALAAATTRARRAGRTLDLARPRRSWTT